MSDSTKKYFERERLLYPYPKTDKQKHSNRIFPALYKASYAFLQTRFPQYFRSQRILRWDFIQAMNQMKKKRDMLMFETIANGGRLMQQYEKVPRIPCKGDVLKIENALSDLDNLVVSLNSMKHRLTEDWKTHLTDEHVPRKHAKQEQATFHEESSGDIQGLLQDIQSYKDSISATRDKIKLKLGLISDATLSAKVKRKHKENKHHAQQRKQQRLEVRASKIAKNLGRVEVFGSISPTVTGNFQISSHEKENLFEVLNAQRRDDHLAETLMFMRQEGIFDASGWQEVMGWAEDNGLI
jgi:hypothetical protein